MSPVPGTSTDDAHLVIQAQSASSSTVGPPRTGKQTVRGTRPFADDPNRVWFRTITEGATIDARVVDGLKDELLAAGEGLLDLADGVVAIQEGQSFSPPRSGPSKFTRIEAQGGGGGAARGQERSAPQQGSTAVRSTSPSIDTALPKGLVEVLMGGCWKTFMDQVSSLEISTLADLKLPCVVCIGIEKSGKSTTMTRVAHRNIFPTARRYCTKMPIKRKLTPHLCLTFHPRLECQLRLPMLVV